MCVAVASLPSLTFKRAGISIPTRFFWSFLDLNVEAEFDHVAIFHFVFLTFDTVFTGIAGGGFGTKSGEVVVVNDFGSDEPAFEVGVDNSCGGGGFIPSADGPGARFLLAGGEVGAQAKKVVDAFDES